MIKENSARAVGYATPGDIAGQCVSRRTLLASLAAGALGLCAARTGAAPAMAASAPAALDATTLHHKMLLGYQGWFACPKDGSPVERWQHWFRQDGLTARLQVDLWPDTSELDPDELFATPLRYPDGRPARVYSAYNAKTVARHFKWMQDAALDGVLLQRFLSAVQNPKLFDFRNQVTRNVRAGAERYGRVFAIEYDISGTQADQLAQLKSDWAYMVDTLRITVSPSYLRHNGLPVLCMWGLGFSDRGGTADQAQAIIDWLRHEAPPQYRVTLVGGVPTGWREGKADAQPGVAWGKVFRSFDVISPWSIGRYADDAGADTFLRQHIIPDMAEARRDGAEYMPVVFPGFSWRNLHNGPLNQIPRRGGKFYWRQVYNALSAGATMIKTAMFDEVDEGTAMFKVAPTASAAPQGVPLVTLDADGFKLPADWYLQVAGQASRMLRGTIPLTRELPMALPR